MSASFTLTLDTTPPAVTWGTPGRHADRLVLPFTLDEPGSVQATATIDGQPATPIVSAVDVVVPTPPLWQRVDVVATANDTVLNRSTTGRSVTRGIARLLAAVAGGVISSAGRVARATAGLPTRPGGGTAL